MLFLSLKRFVYRVWGLTLLLIPSDYHKFKRKVLFQNKTIKQYGSENWIPYWERLVHDSNRENGQLHVRSLAYRLDLIGILHENDHHHEVQQLIPPLEADIIHSLGDTSQLLFALENIKGLYLTSEYEENLPNNAFKLMETLRTDRVKGTIGIIRQSIIINHAIQSKSLEQDIVSVDALLAELDFIILEHQVKFGINYWANATMRFDRLVSEYDAKRTPSILSQLEQLLRECESIKDFPESMLSEFRNTYKILFEDQ